MLAFQRAVSSHGLRIRLRMQGDEPVPAAVAGQHADRIVKLVRGTPRRREGGVIQDDRPLAHRSGRGAAVLAHIGVELRPAGFANCKVTELARHVVEGPRISRPGRAVQVEKSTNVDVPRLTGIEAVEHFHFDTREKVRHSVARGQHGHWLERTYFGSGAQQAFIAMQFCAAGPVEEPGSLIATSVDSGLQWPQDGERVAFRAVQEIAL